ncbi:MAG: tetratricopeptide repeat protein [Woeseiaceae bacterium]
MNAGKRSKQIFLGMSFLVILFSLGWFCSFLLETSELAEVSTAKKNDRTDVAMQMEAEINSEPGALQTADKTCPSDADPMTEVQDLSKTDWAELHESIIETALRSKSIDLLLLGAYTTSVFEQSDELLELALEQNPEDPEVLWHAANLCANARDGDVCERHDWWDRLVEADGQNARAWMGYATFYYRKGDAKKALRGLQQAASMPEANGYFVESIQLYERAYAVTTDWSFQQRVAGAFSILAVKMPPFTPIVKFCQEAGEHSVEVARLCMTYWQKMYQSPMSNELESLLARDMIPAMLVLMGREADAEALRSENKKSYGDQENAIVVQKRIDQSAIFERYAIATPERFARFLELTRSHGERGARMQMLAEQQALIDQGRLDPC